MAQKIIRVGNSGAVLIPKEYLETLGVRIGSKVKISLDPNIKQLVVDVPERKRGRTNGTKLSREFDQWLQTFLTEDKPLLDELADR